MVTWCSFQDKWCCHAYIHETRCCHACACKESNHDQLLDGPAALNPENMVVWCEIICYKIETQRGQLSLSAKKGQGGEGQGLTVLGAFSGAWEPTSGVLWVLWAGGDQPSMYCTCVDYHHVQRSSSMICLSVHVANLEMGDGCLQISGA